jgi:hypothetical protein
VVVYTFYILVKYSVQLNQFSSKIINSMINDETTMTSSNLVILTQRNAG